MNIQWTICDGIAPFFRACTEDKINWSKIPFLEMESRWQADSTSFEQQLYRDFHTYCQKAREIGFNVITLDDIAHLYPCSAYPESLQQKIIRYQDLYQHLFQIIDEYQLQLWITTDLIFWNEYLDQSIGRSKPRQRSFFCSAMDTVLSHFPQIKGVILRFGESDGKDVEGDFISRLFIKSPKDMQTLLQELTPILEQHQVWGILRTWSVGVHRIGDLIWNVKTLERSLKNVSTQKLVLSMKYGESDFFRYLPLNEGFQHNEVPKIIELQGRREYEGAGRFPSFIGYEYEVYRDELIDCPSLVGLMVWVQTGGWTACRRLSFLEDQGLWNDINITTTVALFHSSYSCDEWLKKYRCERLPNWSEEQWLHFCKCSHQVIRRVFYIEQFAYQRLFFRRVRIPPMLGITWDDIYLHPMVYHVIRQYLPYGSQHILIERTWEAVAMAEEMVELLNGHPRQCDLIQLKALAEVMALSREVEFGLKPEQHIPRLHASLKERPNDQPEIYKIHLPAQSGEPSQHLQKWLKIFIRKGANYRLWDHIVTIRLIPLLFPLIYRWKKKSIPKSLRDQAMGIESLFK